MTERVASTLAMIVWSIFVKVLFISTFLPIFLFFTPYYYFSLLYFAWFFYDRNTSTTGSRRLELTRYPFLLSNVAKYWPLSLIKTSDLDPNKNYICGCHPHGVVPIGVFINVVTEVNDFKTLIAFGCGSSTKKSIQYNLSEKGKGNAVFIVIGGLAEVGECKPNEISLILKNRKGFIKVAITNGADLVPVVTFGENELFDYNIGGISCLKTLDNYLRKLTGRPFYLQPFSRLLNGVLFTFLPNRKPMYTVGCGSSTKKSIQYNLSEKGKGNAVFIVIGGLAEVGECKPNEISLILKNRKGFIKVAITNGADLVPVLTFGENEAFDYNIAEISCLKTLDNYLRKLTGRPFYLQPFSRAMKGVLFTFLPNRKPMYTVVGKPIEVEQISNPSDETIDFYHQKYIESLQQLFHDYKNQFGNVYQNHTLTIK
ncbi:Diacylglycerol O-acyltransferase 2 [Chamberlinius hualienensis]